MRTPLDFRLGKHQTSPEEIPPYREHGERNGERRPHARPVDCVSRVRPVLLLLVLGVVPTPSRAQTGWHAALQISPGDARIEAPGLAVPNMPQQVRFVPIHEDDGGVEGAIADSSVTQPWSTIQLRIRGLVGYQFRQVLVQAGMSTGLRGYRIGEEHRNSRNYTNAVGTERRGLGAALTYYNFDGLQWDVGGHLRLSLGTWEHGGSPMLEAPELMFVEYGYRVSTLRVETGWDHFAELETYRTYDLGRVATHAIMIGLSSINGTTLGSEAFIGLNFSSARPNDLGRDAGLDQRLQFVAGLNIAFQWGT
jgi:hypothetical protein